jgi:hypothetical protein
MRQAHHRQMEMHWVMTIQVQDSLQMHSKRKDSKWVLWVQHE